MTQEHPITPPAELVEQRWNRAQVGGDFAQEFATFFARWGADQELEACCEWVDDNFDRCNSIDRSDWLRAARRPKPPSLKEQALAKLQKLSTSDYPCNYQGDDDWDIIRRALEALDD